MSSASLLPSASLQGENPQLFPQAFPYVFVIRVCGTLSLSRPSAFVARGPLNRQRGGVGGGENVLDSQIRIARSKWTAAGKCEAASDLRLDVNY